MEELLLLFGPGDHVETDFRLALTVQRLVPPHMRGKSDNYTEYPYTKSLSMNN